MMTRSPHIYTLSLHDALPISYTGGSTGRLHHYGSSLNSIPLLSEYREPSGRCVFAARGLRRDDGTAGKNKRSEEHTSELQSHHDLVCRLLLEKKKHPLTAHIC